MNDEDPKADTFDRIEPLYRDGTVTWLVAGLFDLGELSAYERSFYAERIRVNDRARRGFESVTGQRFGTCWTGSVRRSCVSTTFRWNFDHNYRD